MSALVVALIQVGLTFGPQFVASLISLFQAHGAEFTEADIQALKNLVKTGESYFPANPPVA